MTINELPAEAKRLRAFRKAEKLTQIQLAEKLETTQANLSKYEDGTHAIPVTIAKKLHELFRMNFEWFFEGKGHRTAEPEKNNLVSDIGQLKVENAILMSRLNKLEAEFKTLHREVFALKHNA